MIRLDGLMRTFQVGDAVCQQADAEQPIEVIEETGTAAVVAVQFRAEVPLA